MKFQPASEEDIQTYSYGSCMWLALAAHARTGWPLEVCLDEDQFISHAWVRMPDGRTFDVAGPGGAEDFLLQDSKILSVTRDELVALTRGPNLPEAIREADRVLDSMGFPVRTPVLNPVKTKRFR